MAKITIEYEDRELKCTICGIVGTVEPRAFEFGRHGQITKDNLWTMNSWQNPSNWHSFDYRDVCPNCYEDFLIFKQQKVK